VCLPATRESKDQTNNKFTSARDSGFLSNGSNNTINLLDNGRGGVGNGRITTAAYPNGGIKSPQNAGSAKQVR
jgi:hypothetical protein